MKDIQTPCLLTVSEVSKILRIQRAKVYILIESGSLDGYKVGGDWRIRTDSVERLIGPLPTNLFTTQGREDIVSEITDRKAA